jgi:hypothetical protein
MAFDKEWKELQDELVSLQPTPPLPSEAWHEFHSGLIAVWERWSNEIEPRWRFEGDHPGMEKQFCLVINRAARLFGYRGAHPVGHWLDHVRRSNPNRCRVFRPEPQPNPHAYWWLNQPWPAWNAPLGRQNTCIEIGEIHFVCMASADCCYELVADPRVRGMSPLATLVNRTGVAKCLNPDRAAQDTGSTGSIVPRPNDRPHGDDTVTATEALPSRAERVAAFRESHECTKADIYRSAGVDRSNFVDWEKEILPGRSVMSGRIEGVLCGKRPLVKGKRKEAE